MTHQASLISALHFTKRAQDLLKEGENDGAIACLDLAAAYIRTVRQDVNAATKRRGAKKTAAARCRR